MRSQCATFAVRSCRRRSIFVLSALFTAAMLACSLAVEEPSLASLQRNLKGGRMSAAEAVKVLDQLSKGAPPSDPLAQPESTAIDDLLLVEDPAVVAAAARLAGAWKVKTAGNHLAEVAGSATSPAQPDAFEALRQIGGPAALAQFSVLARPNYSSKIRCAALVGIVEISVDAAVQAAPDVLRDIESEDDAFNVWRKLLAVPRAPQAFAVRLPRGLPKHVLEAGSRAATDLGPAGESLRKAISRAERSEGSVPRASDGVNR